MSLPNLIPPDSTGFRRNDRNPAGISGASIRAPNDEQQYLLSFVIVAHSLVVLMYFECMSQGPDESCLAICLELYPNPRPMFDELVF